MDREEAVILSLGIIFLLLLSLAIFPIYQEVKGVKTLIYYEPEEFGKPSVAIFIDGSFYEGIEFKGDICIGAKYKIIEYQNILRMSIKVVAVYVGK